MSPVEVYSLMESKREPNNYETLKEEWMKKIVAIDDNEVNLVLLGQIFKIHFPEFDFKTATSGEEGLVLIRKVEPEIVLLDILMPGMNGYEVCEILKNDPLTRNIPVIMISALGQDPNERTKGLNAGADAFISKPFINDELRAQINVVLRIKRAEDLLKKRNKSLELIIKDQTQKFLQNEERFLQISEHASEFYWEVDTKGIFNYISPVIEKIMSVKVDDIIELKGYDELFQIKKGKRKKSKIEKKFDKRVGFNDYQTEIELGNKKIWLSISGFPVIDKTNQFYGFRGVCYDITKRKQAEIALKESLKKIKNYQKRLKKLNTELTLVEEKERRRIAENLHDSLGQTLSLAFLKLSAIINEESLPKIKRVIDETSKLLNIAITESRTITYDLSPPILYELGLVPAFKWKLDQIREKHGINATIIWDDQKIRIHKDFTILLYRIVNELLTNIIKHAHANFIELKIQKDKNFYYLSVQDNGVGFDVERINKATMKGGFGLLSINERLDDFRGQLTIESELGKGTKATVKIPINSD